MAKKGEGEYGYKGKTADLDRMGIFAEMSYLSGKGFKYMPAAKGKRKPSEETPMRFVASKSKSSNQDGYFTKPFARIFQGEAYKTTRKKGRKKKGDDEETPFRFIRVTKKHSTPGDFYGTFYINPLTAMDPRPRKKPAREPGIPNLMTRPAKKGGSGYADITFSKYPPFMSRKTVTRGQKGQGDIKTPFHNSLQSGLYFTENPYKMENEPKVLLYVKPIEGKTRQQLFKLLERSKTQPPTKKKIVSPNVFIPAAPPKKGVYFSKITYKVVPKLAKKRAERKMETLVMRPTWGTKPYPQLSIVSYNVGRSMNITNWRDFKPFVYA